MAKIIDIMKNKDVEIITEFPQCSSNDYRCPQAGGMPATCYIPIRPGSPNLRRRVCENCYYDYEFEGIYTYSYTDEQLRIQNMSEEERFKLWSILNRRDK